MTQGTPRMPLGAGDRKSRFRERIASRNQTDSGETVVTKDDIANLDAFAHKLQEAIALLGDEIAAIKQGQLGVVRDLFEKKAGLLKWIEMKSPVVQPFLQLEVAQRRGINATLERLKYAVDEDSELLSRMAEAARTIVREFEKMNSRSNLSGLYGRTGEKMRGATAGRPDIDREY